MREDGGQFRGLDKAVEGGVAGGAEGLVAAGAAEAPLFPGGREVQNGEGR